jgi:prepilin-type N-terminal cleavage/methylation domain-containing protein
VKDNRGFTLIEIIVSLALLSIISVGMISGLTSQFRFLTSTRNFTEDLSDAQQRMEDEIVAVKKTLEESGTPSGEVSFTLFSGAYERTVAGYPRQLDVKSGIAARSFFTVVGSEVLDFPVATAAVNIKFMPINSTLFEYSSSLYATSDVALVDPDGINLTNIYRWYVSRPGFNIPMISTAPEEVETGTTYPRFPDDYSIIPSSSNTTLASVVSRYPGRHILCTVTPASTSGKMGATAVSNPIFVSGLPVRTDLQLHLDASLVSRESAFNEVRESGGDYYVKNWPTAPAMGTTPSSPPQPTNRNW